VKDEGQVEISTLPGGIRVLTLDRPRRRNALSPAMLDALARALAPDPEVRALLFEARGPAFSAGYDLGQLAADAKADRLPDRQLQETFRMIEEHPAPSVAVVQGPAFGAGCELACACDFRVGSAEALFCMPPVRLGVVYAPDGVWRVARLTGLQRARRMFLTAREVASSEALAWGLLDECLPQARTRGQELAGELASGAPLAVRGLRRTLAHFGRAPIDPAQRAELETLRAEAFASADAQEARSALKERRAPRWRGR
jgi:enoyl-CoA hydratase/carnithine racemase